MIVMAEFQRLLEATTGMSMAEILNGKEAPASKKLTFRVPHCVRDIVAVAAKPEGFHCEPKPNHWQIKVDRYADDGVKFHATNGKAAVVIDHELGASELHGLDESIGCTLVDPDRWNAEFVAAQSKPVATFCLDKNNGKFPNIDSIKPKKTPSAAINVDAVELIKLLTALGKISDIGIAQPVQLLVYEDPVLARLEISAESEDHFLHGYGLMAGQEGGKQ